MSDADGPSDSPPDTPTSADESIIPFCDPFLVQAGGGTARSASVNPGAWDRIFTDQHLKQETDHSPLQKRPQDAADNDLFFTWTPQDKAGNSLGSYQFSSERNPSYFLSNADSYDPLNNTGVVQSDGLSGVMLLRPPPTASPASTGTSITGVILPAFAIGSDLPPSSPISILLAALKLPGTTQSLVTATLKPAPDWKSSDGVKPDQPLQITSNDRALNPINGLWCTATDTHYAVTFRLTYHIEVDLTGITNWLNDHFGGLQPQFVKGSSPNSIAADITFTKSTVYSAWKSTDTTALDGFVSSSISIAFGLADFDIHVDLNSNSITALLVPRGSGSILSMLENAFEGTTGDVDAIPSSSGDSGSSFSSTTSFGSVSLWYVGLTLTPEEAKKISWQFGLFATFNISNENVVLSLTYDTRTQTFIGSTVFSSDLPSPASVRQLTWDARLDPAAALADKGVLDKIPQSLDIFALLGINSSESMVPSPQLLNARVSFQKGSGHNPTIFTIYGRFSFEDLLDELIPKEIFQWDDSTIDIAIQKSATSTDYSFAVVNTFTLIGQLSDEQKAQDPQPPVPTAVFCFSLLLVSSGGQKSWELHASAADLSVRLIESLFDPNIRNDGLEVLESINIASIDVDYTIVSNKASSFDATGVILLGDLELDLAYHRPAQGDWSFTASLNPESPGSTIASIAESIVPGASDKLPAFVGDISLEPSLPNGAPLCLLEFKANDDASKGGKTTILSVFVQIGGFDLTFVQYKTRAKEPGKGVVKRILRISVNQIPLIDHIPIVGAMPQPFDHLAYVWVEDDSSKANPPVSSTLLGISSSELSDIASLMPTQIPPFQVKETKTSTDAQPPPSNSAPTISLAMGHHFVVVVSGKVVLDHVFETSRAETVKSNTQSGSNTNNQSGSNSNNTGGVVSGTPSNSSTQPPASPEAQPTKGSTTTSAGPLSISALTFQYKQGSLIVSVDATLKLGPLTFSVIGFTLGIDLMSVKLDHLADIVTKGLVDVSLHGIQVGVTQGPLTLNGIFIHDKTADYESYRGGIAVGFKVWQVLAVGEYFVHMNQGVEDYKAVFVYGKLDGPLIELEFATISGVRLGFGYNYEIRMPDLTELATFPLISDSGLKGAGNDPGVVLEAIRGGAHPFVSPKQNSTWFAAGMTITALDTITLTAVLVMDVDTGAGSDAGVVIAMLADGIFQMEPLAPPDLSLFYIELVVKVEFNFVHGYIAADAVLAPSSHIYVPMARLVGGASFYTWFGSNPHAGDWVASIGGYARSYQPADWYPKPARVGLSFTVGDNIQMIGEIYCAVTPKCAMAGGSLHMSLSVGPVSAYADLTIDAFINFKPFHFRAEISVSVGVECDIDILFVHIHIGIHLGADLVVWGPHDFGGRAHVDFWFFGFDISFGADENAAAMLPISIDDFITMIQQPGPDGHTPTEDSVGGTGSQKTLHKYSVEEGLAPQGVSPPADNGNFPSTGATTRWKVLAGTLKIRIDCGFALSEAILVQSDPKNNESIVLPGGEATPDVYSWPMHCQDGEKLTSTITITMRQADVEGTPIYDDFRAELVKKSASTAVWKKWSSGEDPLHAPGTPDSLKSPDNATTDLVLAVRILPPEPKRALSSIIDMDATAAMKFTIPGIYKLPDLELQTYFLPQYFDGPDSSGKPIAGPKRWTDFKQLWVPSVQTTETTEVATERASVVGQIAQVLEWFIRPPEQMKGNVAPGTPAQKANSAAIPVVKVDNTANAPRVLANKRTDWELVDEQPSKMVGMLDVYFPALPYICV